MQHNRLKYCECGGKLRKFKNPCISGNGFAYRIRRCAACGAVVYTKQPPEEITGIERGTNEKSELPCCGSDEI